MPKQWSDYPGMKADFLEEGVLCGVTDEMFYTTEPEVQARVREIFGHNERILDGLTVLQPGVIDPPCTDKAGSTRRSAGS